MAGLFCYKTYLRVMNTETKTEIEKSIKNRLKLAGFTDEAQANVWCQAVLALANKNEDEAILAQPAKEQANFRQLLGMAKSAFAVELKAYQKYQSEQKKGLGAERALVGLRSRLENQQTPVQFV